MTGEELAIRYGIDLGREGKCGCPRCQRNGRDNSSNNLHVYASTRSAYCHACQFTIASAEYRAKMGWDDNDEDEYEEVMTREKITPEENEQLKTYTGIKCKGWRGIKDETNKVFGVRYSYDEETGDVDAQYVPTTLDGKLVGYKVRKLPKDFGSPVGVVGKDCDLVGQFKFTNGGRTVLIVGGEIDQLSAYQMLADYQASKGYDPIAVVSPTVGESGSAKQIQAQYEFFNKFDRIIIGFDNDDAGIEATEKVAAVLPKGKIFIASWSKKDPNALLTAGMDKQFISDYFRAKAYTPAGIVASNTIYQEIVERSKQPKLPFPPMLNKLNKMLAGGINYGYIVNILAGSGSGKSSLVNQCVAYWMLECDQPVLVASLEAEAGEFGENLLSYHMGKKISLIQDQQEKIDFVGSQEAEQAAFNLFNKADGTPRLYLLDDRGDYSKLQEKIEEVIISCGVRILVIDVISDVFSGMSIEQIDLWMQWEKKLVKQYNVILIQVAHTRKGGSQEKSASQGRALTEESIIGSGTQYRSAGINIALQRDKTAEDFMERNTTTVHLLKSRATGMTGIACELFYDSDTHTLHDKQEYMATNGVKEF